MLKKTIFQIVIEILLLANVLFWCGKKEGFHVDELYSYHFVSAVEYDFFVGLQFHKGNIACIHFIWCNLCHQKQA